MNQQKIYQKHHHIPRFLVKHISISLLVILIFSFLSTVITNQSTANPITLEQDDKNTEPIIQETKDTETQTTTSPIETETKTQTELTHTASSPSTIENTEQSSIKEDPSSSSDTTESDTSTSTSDSSKLDTKTTITSSTKTNDDTSTTTKITNETQNADFTSVTSSNDTETYSISSENNKTTSSEINLIDKTTEIKNMDSYNTSTKEQSTSTCNLYLEGDIGDVSKNDQITIKTKTTEENTSFIKEINFTASSNQNKVKLTLSEFDEKPKVVKNNLTVSPTNKIYKYVDVKLTANDTYIGETGITTMTFTFTVEKKWVEQNKLHTNTIVMMRYHNDTWANLNTTFVNESEEFLYFKAETPGLSIFAVVGDTVVEDSDAIIDESTHIPVWVSLGVIASSSTLLGVVLVKKRFIYRR